MKNHRNLRAQCNADQSGCSILNKYRNRVHFVVVDLDVKLSRDQRQLVNQYYKGTIPPVVVLDAGGKALYNSAGEVDSLVIEGIFDKSFTQTGSGSGSR